MSPNRSQEPTANDRLHAAYRRWFERAAVVAVVVHLVVLGFFVIPAPAPLAEEPDEPLVVLEPEFKLPGPPEEPARPAEPKISEETSEDITIAPSDPILVDLPDDPGPPRELEPDVPRDTQFTPYTVPPRCARGCSPEDLLEHVPAVVRKAGVSCHVLIGLHVDLEGQVTETRILRSSGNPACDGAVERWARMTSWTTAYNRDVPVAVWIAQPVEVSTE